MKMEYYVGFNFTDLNGYLLKNYSHYLEAK